MGKKATPALVEWQRGARRRFLLVLDRIYDGNQTRLAQALGVSQAYVNMLARGVQPPTRNAMARIGAIEGVNPHWATTGDGEPFTPDVRGTLPVSDVLLPGPPASYAHLMVGERFAVAQVFDRPTCYLWRLSKHHPAVGVAAWRVLAGDLMLLETSVAFTSNTDAFTGRMCVIDGRCLGWSEPAYGEVAMDADRRLVFHDPAPRLRYAAFCEQAEQPILRPRVVHGKRRTVRIPPREGGEQTVKAADPLSGLPTFAMTDVLAVQLMMIRP